MLKIRYDVDFKELEKYGFEPLYYTCFTNDELNTYRYRLKGTGIEIEITNRRIHFGKSSCIWLENLCNLTEANLIEVVSDE